MSDIIKVIDVVVQTATVEIKTLSLSGKQMTLAMFRQIPMRELIDLNTLQLRGEPWGLVNYHSRKTCSIDDYRLHVIWQSGGRLFHDLVQTKPYQYSNSIECRYPEYVKSLDDVAAYRSLWNEIYQHLSRLDQLFIAT